MRRLPAAHSAARVSSTIAPGEGPFTVRTDEKSGAPDSHNRNRRPDGHLVGIGLGDTAGNDLHRAAFQIQTKRILVSLGPVEAEPCQPDSTLRAGEEERLIDENDAAAAIGARLQRNGLVQFVIEFGRDRFPGAQKLDIALKRIDLPDLREVLGGPIEGYSDEGGAEY